MYILLRDWTDFIFQRLAISTGRIMLSAALLAYVRLLDLRNATRVHLYVFQSVSLRDAVEKKRDVVASRNIRTPRKQ